MTATLIDASTVQLTAEEREANEVRFRRFGQSDNRCWCCGKPMSEKAVESAWWVHEVDGGGQLINVDAAEEDWENGGDLGWWPVGPECAKRVPKTHRQKGL